MTALRPGKEEGQEHMYIPAHWRLIETATICLTLNSAQ